MTGSPKRPARKKPAAAKKTAREAGRGTACRARKAGPSAIGDGRRGDRLAAGLAAKAASQAAKRGKAARREAFFAEMHGEIEPAALTMALDRVLAATMPALDEPAPARGRARHDAPLAAPAPKAFPVDRTRTGGCRSGRPSRGAARRCRGPRMSGRIRDLAVSPDGQRAYAVSAKGGVWYSGDAGATWAPVGGWAGRSVNSLGNGNMFSGGALLVDFSGGLAAIDVVMVGTGEPRPILTETGSSSQGGIGVLVALGPSFDPIQCRPVGGRHRGRAAERGRRPAPRPPPVGDVARHRRSGAGSCAGGDERRPVPRRAVGAAGGGGGSTRTPQHAAAGGASRARRVHVDGVCGRTQGANNDITDVVWLANGGRDAHRLRPRPQRACSSATTTARHQRRSRSCNPPACRPSPSRTGSRWRRCRARRGSTCSPRSTWPACSTPTLSGNCPMCWPPRSRGLPSPGCRSTCSAARWPPTQGWYDHGLAVEAVGANDRLYLGGSTVMPRERAELELERVAVLPRDACSPGGGRRRSRRLPACRGERPARRRRRRPQRA